MKLVKIYYKFHYHYMLSRLLDYFVFYEDIYETVSASRSWQGSNVIRQQAVDRASQNYRHSRIYCLLRKRPTPQWPRAKELFLLFFYRCPSLYTVTCFSDIIAYSTLPRFATGAYENPRNKSAPLQRLVSTNISSEFQCSPTDSLRLVKSKGHL